MKKIVIVIALGLLMLSVKVFAGCGACGTDSSHETSHHHSHELKESSKTSCSTCEEQKTVLESYETVVSAQSGCSGCDQKTEKCTSNDIIKKPCQTCKKVLKPVVNLAYKQEINKIMNAYHKDLRSLNKKYKKKLKKYKQYR